MDKLPDIGPIKPYSQSKENSGTGKEKKSTKMEEATKSLPNLDTSNTKSLRIRQIQGEDKFDPMTKKGPPPELKKTLTPSRSPLADLNSEKTTRRVRESSFKENPLTPRVDDSWRAKNEETYNKGINALTRNQQITEKEQAVLPKASKKAPTTIKLESIPPSPPPRDPTPSTISITSSSSSETLPDLRNTPPPPPPLFNNPKKK